MILWQYIIPMIIIETIGLYNLKKHNLFIGIVCYIIVASLLYKIFFYGGLGIINHIWNILSSILGFSIGYLFLYEQLSIKQLFGATLGFFGLFLMNI